MAKKVKKAKKAVKASAKKAVKKSVPKAPVSARKASFLTPLGDRVLVRPLSAEEAGTKSPSGIIIPDTAAEQKSDRGVVLAVGEGRLLESGKRQPLSVVEGDTVLFQWGEKVEFGGKEYYLVTENNIMAIIN